MPSGWKNWRGPEIIKKINEATIKSIKNTGNIILKECKKEVAHDEGILEKTGIVIMAPGNIPQGIISFGGGSGTGFPIIPYAVRWHEEQANFQHGRKWHYVRDPVLRLGSNTLKDQLRKELGKIL